MFKSRVEKRLDRIDGLFDDAHEALSPIEHARLEHALAQPGVPSAELLAKVRQALWAGLAAKLILARCLVEAKDDAEPPWPTEAYDVDQRAMIEKYPMLRKYLRPPGEGFDD